MNNSLQKHRRGLMASDIQIPAQIIPSWGLDFQMENVYGDAGYRPSYLFTPQQRGLHSNRQGEELISALYVIDTSLSLT